MQALDNSNLVLEVMLHWWIHTTTMAMGFVYIYIMTFFDVPMCQRWRAFLQVSSRKWYLKMPWSYVKPLAPINNSRWWWRECSRAGLTMWAMMLSLCREGCRLNSTMSPSIMCLSTTSPNLSSWAILSLFPYLRNLAVGRRWSVLEHMFVGLMKGYKLTQVQRHACNSFSLSDKQPKQTKYTMYSFCNDPWTKYLN